MNVLAAMMGGGALPPLADLIKFPCGYCLAHADDPTDTARDAVTLVRGTLVCAPHAAAVEHEARITEKALQWVKARDLLVLGAGT